MQIQSLALPTSSLTPGSNGLTLKASGISAKTGGHINVNDGNDFPHISASTDLDITFSGVAFSVSILFGNDSSGRATAKTSGCSASVGDAQVHFHGGSSWIYKVVDAIADFGGMLKDNFAPTFCKGVTDAINNQLNHAIESAPVIVKVDKWAEVNYALIQHPVYTNTSVATLHKGEFESLSHPTEAPFSPPPLPPITESDTSKMMYIWLTEYVVNTAGLVYHETGFLAYNITPDKVPKDIPIQLNTSSFRGLIPALYNKYPDMAMLLTVKTTKPPQMQIYPKSANLTGVGEVNVQVITPSKTVQSAFTMGLTVYMNAYAWVHPNGTTQVISANITLLRFTFDLVSSNIGNISLAELNQAVELLVNLFVIPAANVYGQRGLEIPLMDGISFVNPSVSFGEGYVLVSSDINYKPTVDLY